MNSGTRLTDLAAVNVVQFADEVRVRPSCIHYTLGFDVKLVTCNKLLSKMYGHLRHCCIVNGSGKGIQPVDSWL